MAAHFRLTRRATGESVPLLQIDDEMRRALGHPPDPENWCMNWFNTIGLFLALRKTWDQIRDEWPEKRAAVDWLEENFVADAWWAR